MMLNNLRQQCRRSRGRVSSNGEYLVHGHFDFRARSGCCDTGDCASFFGLRGLGARCRLRAGQQALSGEGVPVSSSSPLPVAPPATGNAILRDGTEIPLRLEEELTTKGKQLRVGQRFHLTTTEPVMVNGVNVIPVGTPAEGEITDVRNKGMWGKSGHLAARILYMTLYGRDPPHRQLR